MSENDSKDTLEQGKFRQHCRDWLCDNTPAEPSFRLPISALEIMTEEQLKYLKDWQKSAYDAGLVGCDYPIAYGGGGRTNCQRIANEEMQRAETPYMPNIIGLGMAAPTLLHHGQEELKKHLLPRLFSGEDIWCQGFSEPGSGSDLASVQTYAQRDGDAWVVNGHKVWTSLAHFAAWMIILLRTDKTQKHGGLSYFVVPISSALGKGVRVKPLIKMTGETGFNEVLFEDLAVEDGLRLGALGSGWQVATTTLLHERDAGVLVTPRSGGMKNAASHNADTANLIDLACKTQYNGKAAVQDPLLRDRIMQQLIRETALAQNQRRTRVPALLEHPARLQLQNKLLRSEIAQQTAALAMEVAGASASLYLGDQNAPAGGQWPLAYMSTYGSTIAAGTSEVQRNILGERVLSLAKSK